MMAWKRALLWKRLPTSDCLRFVQRLFVVVTVSVFCMLFQSCMKPLKNRSMKESNKQTNTSIKQSNWIQMLHSTCISWFVIDRAMLARSHKPWSVTQVDHLEGSNGMQKHIFLRHGCMSRALAGWCCGTVTSGSPIGFGGMATVGSHTGGCSQTCNIEPVRLEPHTKPERPNNHLRFAKQPHQFLFVL